MMFSEVQMQSDPANPSGLQDSIPLPPHSVTVVVDRGFGHGPQSVQLSIERTAELPMFEGVEFEMADGRLPVRWYLAEYRPGGDNILLGEVRPAESSVYEGGVRVKVEMEVNADGLCSVDTQWCPLQQATSAGIACPPPLTDVQQDNNHRYVHPMVSSVPVVRPGADIAQQRAGSFAEPAPRVPLRPLNDGRTRGSHVEHDIAVVEDSHEFLVLPVAGSLEFQTKDTSSPIPVYAGHSVLPSRKNSELIGLLLPDVSTATYVDDTSGVRVVVNIGVDANGHRSVSAEYSQCLRTVNSVNYTCSPGVFTVVDPISVIEGQPRTVQTTAMRLGGPTYVKVHQVDRRHRVVRNVSEPVDVRQAVSERTACPPPVSEVQQSCDRCHVQNTAAPAVPFVRPRAHDAKPRTGGFEEPARSPAAPVNDRLSAPVFLDMGQYGVIERTPRTVQTTTYQPYCVVRSEPRYRKPDCEPVDPLLLGQHDAANDRAAEQAASIAVISETSISLDEPPIGDSSTEMAAVLDDEPMILLELQQSEPYEDEPEVQQVEPELIGEPAAFIDVQAAVEDDPTIVCDLPQSTKGQKKKRKLWSRVIRMFTHCFRRH